MRQYATVLIVGLGLVGCTRSERAEVRQEAREVGTETRARTAETGRDITAARREYQEKWQARMERIDREIDEERAKAKVRMMTAKQKIEYDRRMASLEDSRKDTRAKWNQVKNATDENWEKFKEALDTAGDHLENSWNRFVSDMKS